MIDEYSMELRDVSIGYDNTPIVKDVNIKIKVGEFVAIFGENGAGKTTLFKGILQMLPLMNGAITILNKDVTKGRDKSWHRSKIGYVPQKYSQGNFPICVFDATLLGRWGTSFSYFKRPTKEDRKITKEILEIVGLKEFMYQDCRKLSGGQMQRLNIARALVRRPQILLLDEPTTHLDLSSQSKFDEIIKTVRSQYNLSILMISHDHVHSKNISDRIIYMENGRICEKNNEGDMEWEL